MPKSDYIEKYSAQVNLVQSALDADIGRAKLAIKNGALVNHRDTTALRLTPLHVCVVRHGAIELASDGTPHKGLAKVFAFADFLIKQGANPILTCFDGYTYIQYANMLRHKFGLIQD